MIIEMDVLKAHTARLRDELNLKDIIIIAKDKDDMISVKWTENLIFGTFCEMITLAAKVAYDIVEDE